MNIVSIRMLNQQLASPQFSDPAALVAHMCAMQAQEYRMMRWAVMSRTARPSHALFEDSYNTARIVRLHLMRGTWQLVSADDYPLWLRLCASRSKAVIRGWMSANSISLSDSEIAHTRAYICQALLSLGSATHEQIDAFLRSQGISMDKHRLSYHIRMAELDGVICSGTLLPMKATYRLVSTVLGYDMSDECTPSLLRYKADGHPVEIERDEALCRFVERYYRSHSPATIDDLLWWSGLSASDCRRAISLLSDTLESVEQGGRTWFVHRDCRTRGMRSPRLTLLSPYDEYLIGYKSRDIVLPEEYRHLAHNNSGIFYPVILQDGHVVGNWSPFLSECRPSWFSAPADDSLLTAEWQRYRRYLSR